MGKVLLVEDDNNLREIFEMRLQAEGYDTINAADGEQALAVANKEKPELIIADIMMPKLSGFEMLENLQAVQSEYKPKVIIMTALGQAEDQARGEKLGVVKYLVKSQVTLEDFVRVVREVMPPGGTAKDASQPNVDKSNATNKQESEKSMQDDNTNPTAPAGGGDAPAGDAGQMGAADEKKMVDDQAAEAMGSAPAAGGTDAPAGGDASMSGGMTPPASDAPTTPPADGPTTPPTDTPGGDNGGPATPPPAGGGM